MIAISSIRRIALTLAVFAFSVPTASALFQDEPTPPQNSPYVALDSWVYSALRRLAALGYIKGQAADTAPWTRAECRRQTEQAVAAETFNRSFYVMDANDEEVQALISDLRAEFPSEEPATQIRIDSVYTRVLGIGGRPLNDGYHFGQTLVNNNGRPYSGGTNAVTGFSAYESSGRFSLYARGEMQDAPARPGYSPSVNQFISSIDINPVVSSAAPRANKFEPLEMYAGVQIGPENITFGRESLWWGPGQDSAFAFSNNAAPLTMLRFDQTKPLILPGPLRHLGKFRTQILWGALDGHSWPAHPYVNAQKVTIDLTDDFELGFTRSAFFGGTGHPLTIHSFLASLFSFNSPGTANVPVQGAGDPGDRHSGFDFRWRLPGIRNYVTLYSDSYADDDPNPLAAPHRSAWGPGIYFAKIPKIRHLDLRVESYSTLLYRKDYGGQFIYWNNDYHDAYTNGGNLLGSWVGRDARAIVATSRYWLSGKTYMEGQYRQTKTGARFLPGGGTQTDASLSGQFTYHRDWLLSLWLQAERYNIPVLGPAQHDVAGYLQVTYTPRNWYLYKK